MHHMTDEDLDRVLTFYFRCCEQAGIAPLPLDEARAKMIRYAAPLEPAFEITFRQH